MNFLSLALAAGKLVRSSHSSRKNLLILYPMAILQHSPLYSSFSTATTRSSQRKPKASAPQSASISSDNVPTKSEDWPRPSEIPWQIKVANSVSLIGHVQIPVQFQGSPDGKYFAGTVIAQQHTNFSDSPPFFWIPIIFEGDLAHIAACHLKKNDFIHISGQLSVDPPPFSLTEGQANVQVLVHSINYVQGSSPPKKSFAPPKQEELPVNRPGRDSIDYVQGGSPPKKGFASPKQEELPVNHPGIHSINHVQGSSPPKNSFAPPKQEELPVNRPASTVKDVESSWRDLVKNSKQWCDNRDNKENGLVKANYPDFKHKESGIALWLDRAPKWVMQGIKGLEFDVPHIRVKQLNDKKDEDPWKSLVENPNEWWDNRLNKLNVKAPDFKHKDTGKGLWLSDSPAWALSKLPPSKSDRNDAITS